MEAKRWAPHEEPPQCSGYNGVALRQPCRRHAPAWKGGGLDPSHPLLGDLGRAPANPAVLAGEEHV